MAAHSGSEWLVVNSDKGGYVVSLNCSICKTYADIIKGMKNFSAAWAFNGSTNLRISNAEDHARGKPHRKALDLHLKDGKGLNTFERAEAMKTKFETAYFVAKEEMPLLKYPQILKLEEKHGVDIGTAYRSNKSCTTFVNSIGDELGRKLEEKINEVNFFSVFADGSEDASVAEKEAIFVQYLEKDPPGKDTIDVVTAFLRSVLKLNKIK